MSEKLQEGFIIAQWSTASGLNVFVQHLQFLDHLDSQSSERNRTLHFFYTLNAALASFFFLDKKGDWFLSKQIAL